MPERKKKAGHKKPAATLRIDIVDRRLRGGRLNISAGTHLERERAAREQAVRALLERDQDEVDRLRGRELTIEQVHRAYATGDWSSLAAPAAAPADAGELMLGTELDAYLRTVEATAAATTSAQYRSYAVQVLRGFPAETPMRLVTIARAEAFLHGPRGPAKKPWAAATQHAYADFLSSLWSASIEREADAAEAEERAPRLTRNPWKRKRQGGIRLPKKRRTRLAWLREDDWRRLSEATTGTPRRLLYAFGVLAGLRLMEACNLRPMDVDLDEGVIHVRPRDGDSGRARAHAIRYRAWKPKTDNSQRAIPMAGELVEIVREHLRLGFAGERYLVHAAWWDRPLGSTTAAGWTRADLQALDLPYGRDDRDALTFHSFRHTFASWLLQGVKRADGSIDAVDVVRVAELLGDTVEVVIATYAHLMPRNLRDAIGVLDRKLAVAS